MSSSLYEGQAKRARAEIEKQQGKRAAADKKVATAEAAASKYERDAARASSASMAQSKLRQAESKRKDAGKAREDATKASKALADAQKKLFDAEGKLSAARAKEQRSQAQQEERDRKRAERRQREQEAELARLRAGHADLESQLAAKPWATAPEEITVLFIAASPEDQAPLRLDQEVAEIQRRLRMADHRDSIEFAWRPAARTIELMQYLNEHKPHVVQFSGHSDQHGLAFEDADGLTKALDSAQLSSLLTVASDRIRLAIFNSCESSAHAEAACDFIDAAIGMEQSVGDTSAKIFAAQFYNSLGFGHSLQKAFDQARAQLEIETGGVSGNPQLFVAAGLDANEIHLVAPPV